MNISRRKTIGTICDEVARQSKAGEKAVKKTISKPRKPLAPIHSKSNPGPFVRNILRDIKGLEPRIPISKAFQLYKRRTPSNAMDSESFKEGLKHAAQRGDVELQSTQAGTFIVNPAPGRQTKTETAGKLYTVGIYNKQTQHMQYKGPFKGLDEAQGYARATSKTVSPDHSFAIMEGTPGHPGIIVPDLPQYLGTKKSKRKLIKPKIAVVRSLTPRERPSPPIGGSYQPPIKLNKDIVASAGNKRFRSPPQSIAEANYGAADLKAWFAYADGKASDQEAAETIEVIGASGRGASIDFAVAPRQYGTIGGFRDKEQAQAGRRELLAILKAVRYGG